MAVKAKKSTKKSSSRNASFIDSYSRSPASLKALLFIAVFGVIGVAFLITSYAAPGSGKGKPGGGGGGNTSNGSLSIVMVNDQNSDGLPNYRDSLRFNVTTTATTQPHVSLTCYQNGTLVYSSQTGYFDGYPWPGSQTMTLSSSMWTGGAADCTAKGYSLDGRKGTAVYFATLDLKVNP